MKDMGHNGETDARGHSSSLILFIESNVIETRIVLPSYSIIKLHWLLV